MPVQPDRITQLPDVHYVAHIRIEKVTKTRNSGQPSHNEPKREVDEVSNLTFKGTGLNDLIYRTKKHLDIIGDLDDDGEPPFRPFD